MLCTGVQTLQKIRPNQQWPTTHGESPQQENHCNAQGQNIQEEFNNRSSSRQLQPSSNQIQPSSKNLQQTNMLCYNPQLQGYFIWHCHLSHDLLAAPSLYHRCTLVQVTYNTFKSSAINCKNIPKTEQWKIVNNLNCKTMTTVKTVAYIVQWVHMCPNCTQVTSNYLQMKTVDIKSKNSEMNITWTEITRHEESKTVATVKHLQNRCTASAK